METIARETQRSDAPVATDAAPWVPSILVVDDDRLNREPLRRCLEQQGYAVVTAGDGIEALRQATARQFDLVLLDRMMPGMTGPEVLARLRALFPATLLPIVMATASDQTADIVGALAQGANDYITKPFDLAVVLARVRTQLSLKHSVEKVLELERRLSQRNAELEVANHNLSKAAEQTREELAAAAKVQEAFLPKAPPAVKGLKFAWTFEPCKELAGDSLNLFALDGDHVGLYVLDVSGHGVAASLLAVAATRVLSPTGDEDSILYTRAEDGATRPAGPARVAESLNRRLPWNDAAAQFMTLFYVLLDARGRRMSYVSAGHPGAVIVGRDAAPRVLKGNGLPIGVGETYEEQEAELRPGDRIYLYSDGVTETMNPARDLFGAERLAETLAAAMDVPLKASVRALLDALDAWRGPSPVRDDLCVVAVEVE